MSLLAHRDTNSETFEACVFGFIHRIDNTRSLATDVSSKKALVLQLTCESQHKTIFYRFDLLACTFQGTAIDIVLTILKCFARFRYAVCR